MDPDDPMHSEIQQDIHERVKAGVKAVLEQVLEEEMTEHLQAEYRQKTQHRRGERNGHYSRGLITPVGKIEQLQVPRDCEGEFLTEVFERYKRMTGDVEDAVLEMYLQGVSTRRVGSITRALSSVKIGKDAVSRIAGRLEDEVRRWRERSLEVNYPYLLVDACYLKVRWGERVGDLALLVAIGISSSGHQEVLAVETAAGERKAAYRILFRSLLERGLSGVQLVVSDDHEAINQAVATELPEALWQRCVVHFERNVLAHVPARDMKEVAEDLKVIFKAKRSSTAKALAEEFCEYYRGRFPKAVATLERGLADALSFLAFPNSHHHFIRSTNLLERLFREVKRRTKVVGVFPHEASALTLCSAVLVRSTEDWALRRYMDISPLEAMNDQPTQVAT
jgi:transposase-like protein